MANNTMYLPGFSHRLGGRCTQSETGAIRRRANRLDGLAALVARFIPVEALELAEGQRARIYTPWVTFVAFLGQVLTRGSACREAVRRIQAWCIADKRTPPDENTSAYCQARARLPVETLRTVHERVGEWIERHSQEGWRWCGRSIKVLDGCGLSMPDTAENRTRWPYAGGQKPGCGFPTAQMVGLFCLATGRLVRFALDAWKAHEIPLARRLVGWMETREIVLTDRGFCGWGFIALLQRKGVDVVMRAHQARKLKGHRMNWLKPQRPESWTQSLWRELPKELAVRIVRFRVAVPGFRTQEVVLVTTLLDEETYPDAALVALYRRRWAVELCFRDIKTTLGLDVLRCRTPELVEKEVWLQTIAYNLVRALMLEAAWTHGVDLDQLSFKGTVDTLRQWTPLFAPTMFAFKRAREELLRIIAADQVPYRPNRSEPRARKRRPKAYQMLTRPRHLMVVSPSRALK
jgi:Transposase DDE domain